MVRELEALLGQRDATTEKTDVGLLTALDSPQLSSLDAISVFLLYSEMIGLDSEHVTLHTILRSRPVPTGLNLTRLHAWTLVHDSPKAFAWSSASEPKPPYQMSSNNITINPPVPPTGLSALLKPSTFDAVAAGAVRVQVGNNGGLVQAQFPIGDAVRRLRAALAAVEAWWETVRLAPPAWALSSPVFKPEGPLQPSQLPPPFNSIKIAKGTKFEVRYSPLFYKLVDNDNGGPKEASEQVSGTSAAPAASPPLVLLDEDTFLDEGARMGFVRTKFALVAMG